MERNWDLSEKEQNLRMIRVRNMAKFLRNNICRMDHNYREVPNGSGIYHCKIQCRTPKRECPKPKNKGQFDENCLVSVEEMIR